MRLYRYSAEGTGFQPRLAVAPRGSDAVDLAGAWAEWQHGGSSLRLIEGGPAMWAEASGAVSRAPRESALDLTEEGFHLLCPLDEMASLKDFLAFEDHVQKGARRRGIEIPSYWYEAPIYYKGNHRALLGPDEPCVWPSYTEKLDLELELAMIIGRKGRDISVDDAHKHIFGFTVFNDFSARDIQAKETSAWLGPGKGKDFANAFGPCIVTADELGPEPDLEMTARVNDEVWGRSRSSKMHWRWADMIAHVSKDEDIYPGDVFGSGTPGGCCGLDLDRWLTPGDVVELEIEGIGILRTPISERRRG
jgi:2-keto-4-pentenoate hydratase/2-oxohepta-3-ene-1,7-dioic acid hydratase in catechol pathway